MVLYASYLHDSNYSIHCRFLTATNTVTELVSTNTPINPTALGCQVIVISSEQGPKPAHILEDCVCGFKMLKFISVPTVLNLLSTSVLSAWSASAQLSQVIFL